MPCFVNSCEMLNFDFFFCCFQEFCNTPVEFHNPYLQVSVGHNDWDISPLNSPEALSLSVTTMSSSILQLLSALNLNKGFIMSAHILFARQVFLKLEKVSLQVSLITLCLHICAVLHEGGSL